ncbi:GNAT family N-acetyltransferase [Tropicibacter sp. R15_0]|uniref:GNAT family N-acetyltransferase n=1 Tax=Tropicibacter sp. R15_0 TaxID=2821101 RepID=UPI001ADBC5D9|nr:GNAT family N-acetyltransferase [Tropicibacter sp. R15_0]MBO9465082.1 GNAT family N-acetyltransferase [Tropicibacter sp. R15_0]
MIKFKNASLSEVSTILGWAAKEGWNPGIDDAAAFFQADPNGFFVATNDKNEPVAAISVVNHTADFAFLGLYIVCPDWRGKGTGYGLWQHAIGHAAGRTIGLDGVEAQQSNYAISGFRYAGGTTRFTGQIPAARSGEISLASDQDLADLITSEAAASGVEKNQYLRAWFLNSPNRTTIIYRTQDGLEGFCTVRKCGLGSKIGPLIARNASIAQQLIAHAAALFEGPITLDVPESAIGLSALCQRLGLQPGFKTARMYKGPFLPSSAEFFAVTSLELG